MTRMDSLQLLLHPVRVRIVHAMAGGAVRTTSELCALIPDVSKATVYRHVSVLTEAGVLALVGEHRVHGAVERRYQLRHDRAIIDSDAAGRMSIEEHRQTFAAAMTTLIADFDNYLNREGANPTADSVGYVQVALWLNPDELTEMISQVRRLLISLRENTPTPDRSLYLVSPILFPIEKPAVSDAGWRTDSGTG